MLNERIKLERNLTRKILYGKYKIYEIPRAYNNKISCFSPYLINNLTNCDLNKNYTLKYMQLSLDIHKDKKLERNIIENLIFKLLKIKKDNFVHLFFFEIDRYEKYIDFCNRKKIPLLKKEKYNQIKNLIKKWRFLSYETHYKLTTQEKRLMKKAINKN